MNKFQQLSFIQMAHIQGGIGGGNPKSSSGEETEEPDG